MNGPRVIIGPYAMQHRGPEITLQFENTQYAAVFYNMHSVRSVNAIQPAWPAYHEGAALDDYTLERCACICEESTSWGLSPTKEAVAQSTRKALAKFIRAQKSDSPERLAHEAKDTDE